MCPLSKIHFPLFIYFFANICTLDGACHRRGCVTWPLIRIYRRAAALLYALHPFLPGAGCLARAEEGVGDGAEGFGFAGGAGLKDVSVLVVVPRYVEGVALSVAEAVDDDALEAALLLDGLLQRLRLAPVQPQVPTLRDVQGLLTGLQHLVGGGGGPSPAGNESRDGGLQASVRLFGWVVFVGVREGALKGGAVCAPQGGDQQQHNRCGDQD